MSNSMVEKALELGFCDAKIVNTEDLVIVPEYRKYCEENLCGCYGKLPACPPACGTVEEMTDKVRRYTKALVLQTRESSADDPDYSKAGKAKISHNLLAADLMDWLKEQGCEDLLFMSAGPWKTHSCMSAYCVDAQKLADLAGMICWANDGFYRFFSLILYREE